MELLLSFISKILILIIQSYQNLISPFLNSRCLFYPTCSQYAIEVLYKFGIIKGSWLIIKRMLKCHPYYLVSKKNLISPTKFDVREK